MKKWMCICAAAVLAVSALTGCGTSAGAATTAARTEASKEEAAKAEAVKKRQPRHRRLQRKPGIQLRRKFRQRQENTM